MNKVLLAVVATLVSSVAAILVVSQLREGRDSRSVNTVNTVPMMLESLDAAKRRGASRSAPEVEFEGSLPAPVYLKVIDDASLRAYYPGVGGKRYRADELSYMAYRSNQSMTRAFKEHPDGVIQIEVNGAGLREPDEVLTEKPDLRILVTGDSHVSGVVPHDENLAHVLETLLVANEPGRGVETLNAGTGGFNVYNYLGVLERYAYLKPDVFVVVVYGGNDFYDMVRLERYFSGRGRFASHDFPAGARLEAWNGAGTIRSQETNQTRYMISNPGDASIAAQTSAAILTEIGERCETRGIVPVLVYLPPPLAVQSERFPDAMKAMTVALDIPEEQVSVSNVIADEMIAAVQKGGHEVLDLRGAFRASAELLYWTSDFHINTAGHRLTAELLAPVVEEAYAKVKGGTSSDAQPK